MSLESKIKFHLRRLPWIKRFLKKLLRIDATNSQLAELERKLIYQYVANLDSRLRAIENREAEGLVKSPQILDFQDSRPVSFSNPVSQAATQEQMQEQTYLEWCAKLNDYPNYHRKHWEYYFILQALTVSGAFTSKKSRGLGFGVGKDPIVAYMVKQGCEIIATDLDPTAAYEKGWAQTNQYSEKLLNLNERRICSDAELKQRVSLRHVDMNQIPTDLSQGQFDFCWSACAFEHLGSIEKGLQFVENSLKCLKPGGVAVHTTELNLSSFDETLTSGSTVIFRKKDFESLASRLRAQGHLIELNFNVGDQPLDRFYDVPPYSEFNHLKLQLDRFITTSYGLIIKKSNS